MSQPVQRATQMILHRLLGAPQLISKLNQGMRLVTVYTVVIAHNVTLLAGQLRYQGSKLGFDGLFHQTFQGIEERGNGKHAIAP
jgi:hypothetical protein